MTDKEDVPIPDPSDLEPESTKDADRADTGPSEVADGYAADRLYEPRFTADGFDDADLGQILSRQEPTYDEGPPEDYERDRIREPYVDPRPAPSVDSVFPDLATDSRTVFSDLGVPAEARPDDKAADGGVAPRRPRASFGWFTLAGLLAILIAFWMLRDEPAEQDSIAVDTAPTVPVTEPVVTLPRTSPTTSANTEPIATATACLTGEVTAATITFTSDDVGESIPEMFTQGQAYDLGFPTPAFAWSEVPTGATELAILVQRVDNDSDRQLVANGEPWVTATPNSQRRWIVTGIDPATDSMPRSSLTEPLPDGVVEQDHNSPVVTIDDTPYGNKYVGAGPGARDFLFTIFALCEPRHATPGAYRASWFIENAIAVGWFSSSVG